MIYSNLEYTSLSLIACGVRRSPYPDRPSYSQAPAAMRVALSLGEVVRRGVARKRSPCPLGMDYIQAASRARFSHCSTFTPLIKSHKGNNNSP
jgi:hypothetical protein